ncbi:isobutyryl-CoA dehydrogenase, mitochondrial [Glaciecola punicea ACAM 611]|jgi:alkylation response protein AidB-like acyl-CoA dehydrogenase|uniref:Isobutyryl-CoA dehydrogenase, mitochondrial n=1 Tax=Glaciecola punicea ACAM 611 TaxID=1121923 RepID=H5TA58_9ALTE|nr:acyl-CoA dehydrogenase family protein [Glaciecola punicea]OFA33464.1 acyl-CoA dehydrogenase [Glaciecola punicea]GAB55185.1 isobutyryl-CoA dehydrogenase, mitochondrial [Glaciecola punicea ACAM 611]
MNFELSDDQQAFSETAKQFAQQEMAPFAAQWDREHHFPVDVIRKAGELGFCGLYTSEEAGGLGLSRLDSSIIFEQLAMGCTTTTAMLTIHNMATWMIATWGTSHVKEQWMASLVSGENIASYCLTEAGSGSDAANMKSTAKTDGENYILNGSKAFISGAGATQVLVVMARTGVAGAGGISAFFVPADTPGLEYGKAEEKMGWNAQPTRTVSFDNVSIPKSHLLGDEGQGFKLAMQGLDGGRINIATCSIGTAQQALNTAAAYMHEREQFGKPLSTFQALQFKLADMATELVAARHLVRLAASKLDTNNADKNTYCAMAKRFATDVGFEVCNQALQIHGGYGYIKEYPLERHVRDVRVHQILEGTNEIMRVIIARRLLSDLREVL